MTKRRTMDVDQKVMEKLAKEYTKNLAITPSVDTTTLEQIAILEEEQLDILADPTFRGNARINKTVAYLKNLIFRTLTLISKAKGEESYLPSVRTVRCQNNALNRLNVIQIDVFILLDKLPDRSAMTELLILENRKASLIATL